MALGAPEVEDAAAGGEGVVLGSLLNTTTLWVRLESKFWDDVAACTEQLAPGLKIGMPLLYPPHWNQHVS
jgi:hypothetical protein